MIPQMSTAEDPSLQPRRRRRQLKLIEDRASPIVKWVGGKSSLIDALLRAMPASLVGRYHEPFLGGGALFFALSDRSDFVGARSGSEWCPALSDSNADLIDLYREVVIDPVGLHRATEHLVQRHRAEGQDHYYACRSLWNSDRSSWTSARRAATMLYLNRACFNGLFRTNKSGALNTPVGRGSGSSEWPVAPSLARLRSASLALSRADLSVSDFRTALSRVEPGDLVYLDPPYVPRTPSASFRSYTPGGFGPDDHASMAELAIRLAGEGVTVVVSSSDAPGSRDLYPESFSVTEVLAPRAVAASAAGRARVPELILVGGPR